MVSRFGKCQSILDLRFWIESGSIRCAVVDVLSRASPIVKRSITRMRGNGGDR